MNLTQYLGSMVDKYTKLDWNLTSCGPSCGSDHMSWTKAGYPAAFAIESLFENTSPNIHSMHDHWDDENYSFEHMLEFVKLVCTSPFRTPVFYTNANMALSGTRIHYRTGRVFTRILIRIISLVFIKCLLKYTPSWSTEVKKTTIHIPKSSWPPDVD